MCACRWLVTSIVHSQGQGRAVRETLRLAQPYAHGQLPRRAWLRTAGWLGRITPENTPAAKRR